MSQSYKLQKKSFMKHYIIVVVFDCAKVFMRQKFYGIIDNKFWLMFLGHYQLCTMQCNPFHRVFCKSFNIFHKIRKVIVICHTSKLDDLLNSVNQNLITVSSYLFYLFHFTKVTIDLSVESFCILKWELV